MTLATDDLVLLRDGATAHVRRATAADGPLLDDLARGLSPESRRLRFHTAAAAADAALLPAEPGTRGFVALVDGRLVGAASYVPLVEAGTAELAVAVTDAVQGRGVGMRLVERVAASARAAGYRRLLAVVLADGGPMLAVLADLGFRNRRVAAGGAVEVVVDLGDGDAFADAHDRRDHLGTTASLRPLLAPRGIAVVGASRNPASVGHAVLANLLAGDFPGAVHPVNPGAGTVAGVAAYDRVVDAPGPVDLGVLCVPAAVVPAAVEDCIAAGVKAIVVIGAGFAEASAAGAELQAAVRARCRAASVRLVGPNCLGVLVNRPGFVVDATFARTRPPIGNVAISSQSGAVGIALLEQAQARGIGLSAFVSVGNGADVSPDDLLEVWEDDPATGVIALYAESFGDPRRFARVARRVAAAKPIVILKAGRSGAGARAASSHTAALAADESTVDALLAQTGVLRADTIEELFEALQLLAHQPLPAGDRVAIVTNAGGLGILCADACETAGLVVPPLAEATRTRLEALLPAGASATNPVDVLATSGGAVVGAVLAALHDDDGIDAVIVLHAPIRQEGAEPIGVAIRAAWPEAARKPILACLLDAGDERSHTALRTGDRPVPCLPYPESAARALGQAARLARYRRRQRGASLRFDDVDITAITALCTAALGDEDEAWLSKDAVRSLLDAARIRVPRSALAAAAGDVAAAFASLGGGSAVAKIVADGVLHKTDVDGVRVGVTSPAAASEAFGEIAAALDRHGLGERFQGVSFEEEIPPGIECLIGIAADPVFGPVVAFGTGGVEAELAADVAFGVAPLTDREIDDLLGGVRVRRRLDGYRGRAPGDLAAVADILRRVAFLADEVPLLREIDLNPVIALAPGAGAVAVDARIAVARRVR